LAVVLAPPPPPPPSKPSPHLSFPRRTPLLLEVPLPLAPCVVAPVGAAAPAAVDEHRGALRGNPESACPQQPEPNATELPSCAPISASRELRKDCGGGGGDVARRARAARAPEAKSCNKSFRTSCDTSPATSCAASFTCSSFTCHLRGSVGGGMRVLGLGLKAALAADRTSSGFGLASGSPRAAAYRFAP